MMRLIMLTVVLWLAPLQVAQAKELIVFLHNKFLETKGPGDAHPKFGAYNVDGIHKALGAEAELVAPRRGPNADPKVAAGEVAELVEAEIAGGRAPSAIKVVGGSKGAYIAMLASARLKNPNIRYVLLGGCSALLAASPVALTGKVLSIYDMTDKVAGPCPEQGAFVAGTAKYQQIAIDTGAGHGFQFTADERWVAPALAW